MFSDNKKSKETIDYSKNQNKISEGTKIIGDVISKGGFRIEGTIEGNVKTEGRVVVGRTGSINGTLECTNADFEGKFSGKLNITETLSLKSTAYIEGEVIIGKLSVEPGATFNASCSMKGHVKSLNKKSNGEKSA
ncbi:bactofilin family protein [Aquimarina agarilytica]|uniref:bactofilin family protein n=1 Tax=Aquimarina agarilytica TaxID=1087449 RepID=UPI000288272B|nr:polymer-forming cytoskeletal protein [Aquimarina agarilytica]